MVVEGGLNDQLNEAAFPMFRVTHSVAEKAMSGPYFFKVVKGPYFIFYFFFNFFFFVMLNF